MDPPLKLSSHWAKEDALTAILSLKGYEDKSQVFESFKPKDEHVQQLATYILACIQQVVTGHNISRAR